MIKVTKTKVIKFFENDGYKKTIQSRQSRYCVLYFPGSDDRIFIGNGKT